MTNTKHDETITKVIKTVFPAGTKIGKVTRDTPPENRFLVIYGTKGPRWIVPENSTIGYGFMSQWRPYRWIINVFWLYVLWAYKMEVLKYFPLTKLISVHPPRPMIWKFGGWTSRKVLLPAIYIGIKTPLPKVTAGLINVETGKADCVVKIPLTDNGKTRSQTEAKALKRLNKEVPGVAPEHIYSSPDGAYLVQESILGVLPAKNLTPKHITFLKKLIREGKTISFDKIAEALASKITKLQKQEQVILKKALDLISDPARIPVVWNHGDFLPWNLKSTSMGKIVGLDWEYAKPNGIPLYDIFYYFFVLEFFFGKRFDFQKEIRKPHVQGYLDFMKIRPEILDKLILACMIQNYIFLCGLTRNHKRDRIFLLDKIQARVEKAGKQKSRKR